MSSPKYPPWYFVLGIYSVVLVSLSWLIVHLNWPDSLLFIFWIPCMLAPFYYGRQVYWTMIAALVVAGVWVTALISLSFATSLVTIAIAACSGLAIAEGMRALILARAKAQAVLNQQEERFRTLAHDLPALVCEFLPDSTLTFVNRAYCEFFDMPAAALIGRRFLDFLPEDDQVAAKQAYLSLTPQHPTNLYTHAVLKDGETHWQEWRDRAIFDKDGQAVLFQSIGFDITERERAEEALRKSEETISSLVDSSPYSIQLLDPNGYTIKANKAHFKLFGSVPPANYTVLNDPVLQRLGLQDDMVRVAQGESVHFPEFNYNTYEVSPHLPDNPVWIRMVGFPLFDRDGRVMNLVLMHEDITARKRAEQTLQQSEQRYRELYVTAQRQMHELSLLNQVRTTLARELDLPTIFRTIVEAIAETFGYTLVSLYLREGDHLVLQHQVGYEQLIARFPVTVGVSGRVARTGEPILLQDVRTDPIFLETMPDIISEACVPLVDQGQVVGILNIESSAPRVLTEGDLALLIALGEHVDIAIERARLYTQVRDRERHLEELVQARTAALRESESRFRTIYNTANALIMAHDTESKIIFINPYACQTLGYRTEELLDQHINLLLEESEIQRARPLTAKLMTDPEFHIEGFEQYLLTKDGQRVLISWNVTALQNANENVVGILGIGQDITARKQMETELTRYRDHLEELVNVRTAELQENQALLEQTVQTLQDREHFLSTLHDITRVALESPGLRDMLQTLADRMGELLRADGCYLALWDEKTQESIAGAAYGLWRGRYNTLIVEPGEPTVTEAVLRAGHPIAIEDVYDTPYLSRRIASLFPDRSLLGLPLLAGERKLGAALIAYIEPHQFTPIEIARGEQIAGQIALAIAKALLYQELQAYAGQLEQRVQERTAALQAQYAQLDAILRSVGDAIFMTDAQQRILYANPAFTALTGYTAAEVLEQDVRTLAVLQEFVPRLPAIIPTQLQGEFWQGDIRVQRKDGRYYDAALTIAPMYDNAGQITGHVFTHRDVSQAKDLERARTQFITNVSHQFLTPLTPLKTGIYLLQRTIPCEQRKQQLQLQAMQTGIDWLIHLVKDTLEILVLDSGKGVKDWAPVSLIDVVAEVLKRYQDQAQAAGLTLTAAPIPPLPAVQGDEERLVQALSELVENAVAFTPAGGHVNVTATVEEEAWVAIAVQDTGPGITPEELPRLFERFYRGRLADSGHTTGVGLGLSIAQKIAEAHGGRITVESIVGEGSAFTLWLRVAARSPITTETSTRAFHLSSPQAQEEVA